jgi:hypothetical protein
MEKHYIIWKDSRWIVLLPEKWKFTLSRSGKWVYRDKKENLERIAFQLTSLIEQGPALQIKYRHAPYTPESPYYGMDPIMCVYCHDKDKQTIEQKLKDFGLRDIFWKE